MSQEPPTPRRLWFALLLIVAAMALLAAERASAEDQRTCAATISAFDHEDRPRIADAVHYITGVMDAEDGRITARGGASVLAPLAPEGRDFVTALAVGFCRRNPGQPLQRAAAEAYRGFREFQRTMGNIPDDPPERPAPRPRRRL